jgi:hypothetical protein
MSSNGVPIQDITDTVGRKSTHVTETVCRHAGQCEDIRTIHDVRIFSQ